MKQYSLFRALLCCIAVLVPQHAFAQNDVPVGNRQLGVYKVDGSLQCQPASGISLELMAGELTGAGVAILSQEKRSLPFDVPTECGKPTGRVNYYTIKVSDLGKVNLDPTTKNFFEIWAFNIRTVLVVGEGGAVKCGSPNLVAQMLINSGIIPIERMMRQPTAQVARDCGTLPADISVFRIPATDLPAAKKLGFSEISS